MDPVQLVAPALGIAAAAALTFYAVSFKEMSEKSFEDLDSKLTGKPQLRSNLTSKEKRQLKQTRRQQQQKDDV